MKKVLSAFALSLTLCASLILPASHSYAASTESISSSQQLQEINSDLLQGKIDLNNLESLGDQVTVEEMSYEEAIAEIAENSGRTVEEVRATHPDKTSNSSTNSKNSTLAAASTGVSKFSVVLDVNPYYNPTLMVYAITYHSGSFYQFNEMFDVQMNAKNTLSGLTLPYSKVYGGNLTAKIVNPTQIYWIVNGQFCNNGETSTSGGVQAGNQAVSVTVSFTYTSSHYAYYNNEGAIFAP
ncbi:hypothetical protein D3C75_178660 [compost metagenome]